MIVQFRVDSYSGLPIFISCGCPLQLFINPYVTVGGAFPMGGEYYLDYKVDRKKVRGIVSRDRFVSTLAELKSLHIFLQNQYIPHLIATVCGINNQHDVFYNHVTKLSQQPLE